MAEAIKYQLHVFVAYRDLPVETAYSMLECFVSAASEEEARRFVIGDIQRKTALIYGGGRVLQIECVGKESL